MPTAVQDNELLLIAERAQRSTQTFVEGVLSRALHGLLIEYTTHLCHELIWKANIKFAENRHSGPVEVEYELPDEILSTIRASRTNFEVMILEHLENAWPHGDNEAELRLGNFHGQAWSRGIHVRFIEH